MCGSSHCILYLHIAVVNLVMEYGINIVHLRKKHLISHIYARVQERITDTKVSLCK